EGKSFTRHWGMPTNRSNALDLLLICREEQNGWQPVRLRKRCLQTFRGLIKLVFGPSEKTNKCNFKIRSRDIEIRNNTKGPGPQLPAGVNKIQSPNTESSPKNKI